VTIFIVYKHAFLRFCSLHVLTFLVFFLPLPFVFAVLFQGLDWRTPIRVGLCTICVTLGIVGIFRNTAVPTLKDYLSQQGDVLNSRVSFAFTPVKTKDKFEGRKLALEDEWSLPLIKARVQDASVDVIAYEQGVIFYNQLNWRPRPVFQSHGTSTPYLS